MTNDELEDPMPAPTHIHVPYPRRAPSPPSFEGRLLPHPDEPVFDQGLVFDVGTLLSRRQVIRAMGFGAMAVGVAACMPGSTPGATGGEGSPLASSGASPAGSATAADCDTALPEETAGPYPGDGSNGPDVLSQSGVVRQDIRASFGSSTTIASGVPLTIRLAILDLANGCAPLAGAAVYAWHCDQQGRYSMYTQGAETENYLRGVQAAGADGVVTFQSIFPACYSGRWPHIHFEVYSSVAKAVSNGPIVKTSQIALPQAVCKKVYATSGYSGSLSNLARTSLSTDMVFSDDNAIHQLATVKGDVKNGFVANLTIGI